MANLLIADDEADIVQLVKRFAEFAGHTVLTASDGAQAVELCSNHSVDVAILDVMMPGMDGFAACREIRSRYDIPGNL